MGVKSTILEYGTVLVRVQDSAPKKSVKKTGRDEQGYRQQGANLSKQDPFVCPEFHSLLALHY